MDMHHIKSTTQCYIITIVISIMPDNTGLQTADTT